MSNPESADKLPTRIAPVSSGAHAAAADVVKTQVAWSNLLKEGKAKGLVPAHLIGYSRSICGATLLESVVPFLDRGPLAAERLGAADVPLDVLLGDSWSWTTECLDADDQNRLEAWLSHQDRSDLNAKDVAIYCVLPALGIYWAHEGKNRVQFLRDRGMTHVPANLTTYSYPAPGRIELFTKRILGRNELWAVLDRRWVQPILLPHLGTRVLREYGVAAASRWPQNWPDAEAVAKEMYRGVDPDGTRPYNLVDLHPLEGQRREKVRGYERVETGLFELDGFSFRLGLVAAFVGGCVLLAFAGALSGTSPGNVISGVGLGALGTFFGLLFLPVVRTTRHSLEFAYRGRPDHHELSLEAPKGR